MSCSQVEIALTSLMRATDVAPDHAEAWGRRGEISGELGKLGEQRECYEKAVKAAPLNIRAWERLAEHLLATGEHSEARRARSHAERLAVAGAS